MAKSWNVADDVKDRIAFLGDELTYALDSYLEDANRRVKTSFGKYVEEKLNIEYDGQRAFRLSFADVHKLLRVQLNESLVSSDHYTFTDSADADDEATIEFTQDFYDKYLKRKDFNLFVDYIPKAFVDIELQYAIEEILTWSSIQNNDSTEDTRLQNARDRVEQLSKEIKRKMPPLDGTRGMNPVFHARYI